MPWRSASASFPVAMSNWSRDATSDAIASGEEQSMRIFSSQSRVMKAQRGSTSGFTTLMLRPKRSEIVIQYSTAAEPIGSAPMRNPESRIASRSMISGSAET